MSPEPHPFAYDSIPYPTRAQPQTHPDRLAAVGMLHGLHPASVATARILELGCGDAGNLAPIAAAFPESRCLGLDLAGAALERGRELARAAGVTNLELQQADVTRPGALDGEFDYILCHGLYSWVPEAARDGILRICRDHLAPEGLALVSYNALPGSCVRGEIRRMLHWHLRDLTDPDERLAEARALVGFLATATIESDEIRRAFRAEHQTARAKDPGFLFHDELAEHYAPVYLHEFMTAAGRHRLQFIGDADPAELIFTSLPAETRAIVAALGPDRVERQQYLDFIAARRFRHTILGHADHSVADEPRLDRVRDCWFSTQARCTTPDTIHEPRGVARFERGDGLKLETDFLPGKLALHRLAEEGPHRISFAELASHARERMSAVNPGERWNSDTPDHLARFLLEACSSRVATLHGACPRCARTVGEQPLAFPTARVQASDGPVVTTIHHHTVRLEDRWSREILARADGHRSRDQLVAELDAVASGADSAEATLWRSLRADFPSALASLGRQGLLIA